MDVTFKALCITTYYWLSVALFKHVLKKRQLQATNRKHNGNLSRKSPDTLKIMTSSKYASHHMKTRFIGRNDWRGISCTIVCLSLIIVGKYDVFCRSKQGILMNIIDILLEIIKKYVRKCHRTFSKMYWMSPIRNSDYAIQNVRRARRFSWTLDLTRTQSWTHILIETHTYT